MGIDPKPNKAGTRPPSSYLHHDQLPLPRFSIGPLFSKTEVDLVWWLFLNLSLLMGNQLYKEKQSAAGLSSLSCKHP